MHLLVQPLSHIGLFAVEVPDDCTVEDLKRSIEDKVAHPPERQLVILRGKKLDNGTRLTAQLLNSARPSVVVALLPESGDSDARPDDGGRGRPRRASALSHSSGGGSAPSRSRSTSPAARGGSVSPARQQLRQQLQQAHARLAQPPQPPQPPPQAAPPQLQMPRGPIPVEVFPVNPGALRVLLDMGFAEMQARKALLLHGMNPAQAAEWLLQHSDDGEADGPLTPQQAVFIAQLYHRLSREPAGPASVPPEVQECIDNGICTFSVTGPEFQPQPWVHCFTCGLIGDKGCCLGCAKSCHAGHRLSPPRAASSFFCDCGAGAAPEFRCRSVRGRPPAAGGRDAAGPVRDADHSHDEPHEHSHDALA